MEQNNEPIAASHDNNQSISSLSPTVASSLGATSIASPHSLIDDIIIPASPTLDSTDDDEEEEEKEAEPEKLDVNEPDREEGRIHDQEFESHSPTFDHYDSSDNDVDANDPILPIAEPSFSNYEQIAQHEAHEQHQSNRQTDESISTEESIQNSLVNASTDEKDITIARNGAQAASMSDFPKCLTITSVTSSSHVTLPSIQSIESSTTAAMTSTTMVGCAPTTVPKNSDESISAAMDDGVTVSETIATTAVTNDVQPSTDAPSIFAVNTHTTVPIPVSSSAPLRPPTPPPAAVPHIWCQQCDATQPVNSIDIWRDHCEKCSTDTAVAETSLPHLDESSAADGIDKLHEMIDITNVDPNPPPSPPAARRTRNRTSNQAATTVSSSSSAISSAITPSISSSPATTASSSLTPSSVASSSLSSLRNPNRVNPVSVIEPPESHDGLTATKEFFQIIYQSMVVSIG